MKLEVLMITITGSVGSSGKYLVTGLPVDTTANAVLKMAFENNTSGTNLGLFAGTGADFESGSGGAAAGILRQDAGTPTCRFAQRKPLGVHKSLTRTVAISIERPEQAGPRSRLRVR
jgi:hypothetical protein